MSGSAATSSILNPGGSAKVFCSCSGVSGSVIRTFSANGSAAKLCPTCDKPTITTRFHKDIIGGRKFTYNIAKSQEISCSENFVPNDDGVVYGALGRSGF